MLRFARGSLCPLFLFFYLIATFCHLRITKNKFFDDFFVFLVHMSKKSSTFAPLFVGACVHMHIYVREELQIIKKININN